jgi:hypothetical protein
MPEKLSKAPFTTTCSCLTKQTVAERSKPHFVRLAKSKDLRLFYNELSSHLTRDRGAKGTRDQEDLKTTEQDQTFR